MRPSSIATQMAMFTCAVLAAATLLSFSIALALPPPAPGRVSVDEIAWALAGKPSKVISVHVRNAPPTGVRVGLVERAVARAIGAAPNAVRAVWSDPPEAGAGRGQSIIRVDGRDMLVDASENGFQLRYGGGAALRSGTLLPLVTVALRRSDGRWATGVPDDPARTTWVMRIAAALLLGLLAVLPLALLVSRRITLPIRRLSAAAERVSPASVNPFPTEGPLELRTTAAAMNAMHERLRDHGAKRIASLAGMAHDLRTPLTALKLRVESLPSEQRDRLSGDIERIAELTSAMLDDATIGAYVPTRTLLDLGELLRSCCATIDPKGGIRFRSGGRAPVETDPILARRLIGNLLENARRFGANVTTEVTTEGTSTTLTITDDGPGIPEEFVADATRPYRQLSPDGPGFGLGLAIVTDIASAIDVEVTFHDAGPGLRAQVRFDAGNTLAGSGQAMH